jgi:TolB-like protein
MKKRLLVLILVVFGFSAYSHASDNEYPVEKVKEEGPAKIAILPFNNFSKDFNATKMLMPGLRQRLTERGFHVVDDDSFTDFLCERKVRNTGYISKNIAQQTGSELKAKAILAGSVVSFESEGIPKIGILARLIDTSTGVILWADYVSVSGDDYAGVFGLGTVRRIEELIPRALDRLFASFTTEKKRIDTESVYRIAVMPFKNRSKTPNAGVITTYMFLVELLKEPKFEPVEYGEVKDLCFKLRIKSKGELEYRNIKSISDTLGVYVILLGSVDDYSYEMDDPSKPNVGITARLLDARNNRILWYNTLQLSGEKSTIAFEWGRIRQVDKLAYKTVSKLVKNIGSSEWY